MAKTKFPKPQYLGAKFHLLDWITQFIPESCHTILDGFGGSQSFAYRVKELGYKVITNDFLLSQAMIGNALIVNKSERLDEENLACLFEPNKNKEKYNLMETQFKDLFFNEEDCKFLDAFRSNVDFYFHGDFNRTALALAIMDRAMTRKVTMGHFAHTKAMEYSSNPDRLKRNPSLGTPLKNLFLDLVDDYNNAVFDNGYENFSFNTNILELLPIVNDKIDLAYFDPPYCGCHADYQSFYHVIETYCRYWKNKEFVNSIHRYEPKMESGFDKKLSIKETFDKMFSLSKNIPYWLVSYNDGSYPTEDEMVGLIEQYKKVTVKKFEYQNARGGKGSVKGRKELLFVCSPL